MAPFVGDSRECPRVTHKIHKLGLGIGNEPLVGLNWVWGNVMPLGVLEPLIRQLEAYCVSLGPAVEPDSPSVPRSTLPTYGVMVNWLPYKSISY